MDNNTPTTSSNKKPIDKIFSLLKENKVDEAYSYVKSGELREVETTDEHGTTPLQYASFRGLLDMCKLLVSRGADVNAKTHDQGYTALMFAAISNHTHVVRYLLELGADIDYTNTIGRTAAQMATFVNSNEAADLINSYISKSDLEYYTKVNSIDEKEPKLPKGECCNELHKLLTTAVNYSPVRIMKAIKLASNNVLMANLDRVIRTLDAFSRKAFRDEMNECPNDILSFKLHYYKYIFEYLSLQKKKLIEKQISEGKKLSEQEIEEKVFDLCIRQLLTEEQVQVNIDGETKTKSYRVFEEKFVRESIRQYPYKECALLRQMVTILARVAIGSQPSALYVIKSCMHGQKFNEQFGNDDDEENSKKEEKRKLLECVTCSSKSYDAKWCTHCKKVAYCDQFCQRLHWPIHKKQTAELAT